MVLFLSKYFHMFFHTFVLICDTWHSSFLTTISHWRPQTLLTYRTQSWSATVLCNKKKCNNNVLYSRYPSLLPNDEDRSRWYIVHIFIHTMYYIQTNHSQNCTNRAHWSWQFLKFCLLIGKHFLLSTSYIIGKIILSPIKHLHFLDVAYNTQSCPVRLSCSFWKKITFVSWKLYIKYTNIYKQTIHMWMCCWNLGLHNDKPSINYKKHDTSTHIMIAYTQMKKNV